MWSTLPFRKMCPSQAKKMLRSLWFFKSALLNYYNDFCFFSPKFSQVFRECRLRIQTTHTLCFRDIFWEELINQKNWSNAFLGQCISHPTIWREKPHETNFLLWKGKQHQNKESGIDLQAARTLGVSGLNILLEPQHGLTRDEARLCRNL